MDTLWICSILFPRDMEDKNEAKLLNFPRIKRLKDRNITYLSLKKFTNHMLWNIFFRKWFAYRVFLNNINSNIYLFIYHPRRTKINRIKIIYRISYIYIYIYTRNFCFENSRYISNGKIQSFVVVYVRIKYFHERMNRSSAKWSERWIF